MYAHIYMYTNTHIYICIGQSQSPNSPQFLLPALVTINLFSTSVSLFLLCK